MDRRDFSGRLAAVAAAVWCASPVAQAQGAPVEGTNYTKLQQAAPTAAPAGKVEVIEFFWYGCPHCYALEPMLEAWVERLPPDVSFRRIPVAFGALHEMHQKLFYTLEAMGQLPTLHKKVFSTIHGDKKRLDKEADIVAFATANGLDGAKFSEVYKSFSVATKVRQAGQMAAAYHVDAVPTLGIHGRYTTSVAQAGGQERVFPTVDFLIQQTRAQR